MRSLRINPGATRKIIGSRIRHDAISAGAPWVLADPIYLQVLAVITHWQRASARIAPLSSTPGGRSGQNAGAVNVSASARVAPSAKHLQNNRLRDKLVAAVRNVLRPIDGNGLLHELFITGGRVRRRPS